MASRVSKKGLFLSFEGGEGAGKSTVALAVKDKLERVGIPVLLTREPGGISLAEQIREIILSPANGDMDKRTEAMLFASARRQHLIEKVLPALERGEIVICDRFIDSSLVYQGYVGELGFDTVMQINKFATEGLMPNKTFWFDIEPEEGLRRISQNEKREVTRIDLAPLEFHHKVREGYEHVHQIFPDRVVKVDASRSVEEVTQCVIGVIKSMTN